MVKQLQSGHLEGTYIMHPTGALQTVNDHYYLLWMPFRHGMYFMLFIYAPARMRTIYRKPGPQTDLVYKLCSNGRKHMCERLQRTPEQQQQHVMHERPCGIGRACMSW